MVTMVLWILLGVFVAYWILFGLFWVFLDRRDGNTWIGSILEAVIVPPLMLGLAIFFIVGVIWTFDITGHFDDGIEES